MTRHCALCGCCYEPKEKSHIVSAFAYRWLKETSVTGFMRHGPRMNRRDQDGLKDYFLCEVCEDRFSLYEGAFAKTVFYPLVADSSSRVHYGEDILKFAVSASWRVLAYAKEKHRLEHFRGRHEGAISETLATWTSYLLGDSQDIGRHQIHLLPYFGVVDYSGENAPSNLNRYLRRSIEIDTVVSDAEAVTYCKLGPLILIGLIEYPDLGHWQNTEISKTGLFEPKTTVTPAQYRDYIFKRCRRSEELEAGLSTKQRQRIEMSYVTNASKIASSGTVDALLMDLALQSRKNIAESEGSIP